MTRTNIFSGALLILLTGNLYSSPILAEKKSQPIYIESDSLHVEDKRSTSQFNGNVKFKQGDLIIHADSIQAKSKNGSISTVVIKGRPIKMNQRSAGKQAITANANKIEYFADSEMVHLYGNALLQQGSQQFRGEHIQYNSRSQQVIANGSQQTVNSNGQGRVKAVIMPKTKMDSDN
jgi:lipopolysaccharide export system protein LptA